MSKYPSAADICRGTGFGWQALTLGSIAPTFLCLPGQSVPAAVKKRGLRRRRKSKPHWAPNSVTTC